MFPSQKCAPRIVGEAKRPASMGPGCFHPRNRTWIISAVHHRLASMGPGCFHPRNESGDTRAGIGTRRFNGAGMFPSQKFDVPDIVPEASKHASMGPGCFHPRNLKLYVESP